MIKILQVMDNIVLNSGVSSIIMNIYRNIDREKVQFDFLVSNRRTDSYEAEIRKLGGHVYYIGNPLSPKTVVSACRNSRNFFRKHAGTYTAVHLNSPTIAEMTVRYARRYGIKNIIIHSHSSMFSDHPVKKLLNTCLTARIKKYATHAWYCSDQAGKFLFGDRYKELPGSEWIRNGIEAEAKSFHPDIRKQIRTQYALENKKVACHVSNFSPIKNLEFLVPVMQRLYKKDSSWHFLFVGDGPCKEAVEEKIKQLGLESACTFTGFSDKVGEYLNAADVFLLPSIREGLPVVAIEAQACGLPCFLSDSITRQADTGGCVYLPLERKEWYLQLTKFKVRSEKERKADSAKFAESAFNIKKEAKRIEQLYRNMDKE